MSLFQKKTKRRKIGLALGGGAVLGAVHIGVLKALAEREIPIDCVAGTSIGAFVAAFLAYGLSAEEIEGIVKDLNWLDVSGISLSRLGLLSNKKMGDLIEETIGELDIMDLRIPLNIIATDITSGDKYVFTKGSVATAVMASTCIPGVFIPVEWEGKLLVDGGLSENVPVSTLKEMNPDFVIAVDLMAGHPKKEPENIIEVLIRSFDFTLKAATSLQTKDVDILIKPDLTDFNMIKVDQIDDLIEIGYNETMRVLEADYTHE